MYDLLLITFLGLFSGLFASDKHAAKINFWKSFILINVSLPKNEFYSQEFNFLHVKGATSGVWRWRYNYDWSCWVLGVQTIRVIMFYFGTSARRILEVQSFFIYFCSSNNTIEMTGVLLTRLSEIFFSKLSHL